MMRLSDLLLSIFAEECAELAKEAVKVQRFGLYSKHTVTRVPNDISLKNEMCDVYGMLTMLDGLNFFGVRMAEIETAAETHSQDFLVDIDTTNHEALLSLMMSALVSAAGKAMFAAMGLQEDHTAERQAFFVDCICKLYALITIVREYKMVYLPFAEMIQAGKDRQQRTINSVDLSAKLGKVKNDI
jgi:hypothetical protein